MFINTIIQSEIEANSSSLISIQNYFKLPFLITNKSFAPSANQDIHISGIEDIKLDFSNQFLLTANKDGSINLFDTNSNDLQRKSKISQKSISNISWYFDSGLFTVGSNDHKLRVFSTESFEEVFCFKLESRILCHKISSASTHSLISCGLESSQDVILCDLRSGAQSHRLFGHKDKIYAVDWHPTDYYLLSSASADCCVKLWDIRKPSSSNQLLTLGGTSHNNSVNGLSFSPCGMYLISSGKDCIKSWSVFSGLGLHEYNSGFYRNKFNKRLNFHVSNGKIYVPNGTSVLIFDLVTGELLQELRGGYFGTGNVSACCVKEMEDGFSELYTSGVNEDEVLVWNDGPTSNFLADEDGIMDSLYYNESDDEEDLWDE